MSTWTELVSAALVGTDRRAFVPGPAIPAGADPAQALVQQAMLFAVPSLMGVQPAQYEGALPEPAPTDDRPLIPGAVRLRLHAVLGVHPNYLAEWLAAVQASGNRLPLADMPDLLDAGRNNVSIRGALAEALGSRGRWLARQNPDWRYLLREPFGPLRPEDWDGPDPDARIAYASGLYAADPAAARALLETAWPTLTAHVKLTLLGLVRRYGTKADLIFVNGLAQDSSKQVRDEAKSIEAQLKHREEETPERSPEEFAAEVVKFATIDGFNDEFYRLGMQRAGDRWPLEAARAVLAALAEYSRRTVTGETGDRTADMRRNRNRWAAGQLVGVLADRAPLELLPDVERVVRDQTADIAVGAVHQLDFTNLLIPLGFRADMHAELTASADAGCDIKSGQE